MGKDERVSQRGVTGENGNVQLDRMEGWHRRGLEMQQKRTEGCNMGGDGRLP